MNAAAPSVLLGSELAFDERALEALVADGFAGRLFARDATLWGEDARPEAEHRLGWVDAHLGGAAIVDRASELRSELVAAGVDRIVLCGMGGSSLAPEVITARDDVPLVVLDSTHPDQVRRALQAINRTAIVVSSKSGSTVETLSQLSAFEAAFTAAGIDPARRVVVVTDPGSALERAAETRGYRCFLADPEVGGRYSALTAFGLVPSVLAGADCGALLAEAAAATASLSDDSPENPALRLAVALSSALPERYLCGLHMARRGVPLADWIEQLVAESTGKHGRGVLPISLTSDAPELHGALPSTENIVELQLDQQARPGSADAIAVSGSLGGQFLLWEVATAALGRLIGVNPFDQPDVEAAKIAAREALAQGGGGRVDALSARPEETLSALSASVRPEDYVVIQAYVDREADAPLDELRSALVHRLRVPVALGFGPRYLHSTGQFHKGGPARGVFLQILDPDAEDLPIPGGADGFAALIAAQARGDREVLAGLDRPVFTASAADVGALLTALRSSERGTTTD